MPIQIPKRPTKTHAHVSEKNKALKAGHATAAETAQRGNKKTAKQPEKPNPGKSPAAETKYLTVQQVALRWNMSARHVHRMIENGSLEKVHFGRAVRVPFDAVRAFEIAGRQSI